MYDNDDDDDEILIFSMYGVPQMLKR